MDFFFLEVYYNFGFFQFCPLRNSSSTKARLFACVCWEITADLWRLCQQETETEFSEGVQSSSVLRSCWVRGKCVFSVL